MGKIKNILKKGLLYIIVIPIVMLLLIGLVIYLLFLPFDILRYHRTPYYRDLKKKYRLFATSKDTVTLYNRIKREHLPIDYFCKEDFEYFVKDSVVLFPDKCYDSFEEKDGKWVFIFDSGSDDADSAAYVPMQDEISKLQELLCEEHKSLPARFLIFASEPEKHEKRNECPFCYFVSSLDDFSS